MPATRKVSTPPPKPGRASEDARAPGPYTMIPNILIDKWMPILPLAEFRVLLYIARRTYGFHRDDVEMGMRLIAQGKPREGPRNRAPPGRVLTR